jgi:hypothetical protein
MLNLLSVTFIFPMSSADDRILQALQQHDQEDIGREDRRARASDSEESEEENQQTTLFEPPVLPSRPGPNTGPKGVLADYAQYRREEREKREAEKRAWQAKWLGQASTAPAPPPQPVKPKEKEEEEEEDELLRELELEEDDPVLQHYREMRIRDMLRKPVFGKLIDISRDEYVDQIDNEARQTTIVIHLYEPVSNHLTTDVSTY